MSFDLAKTPTLEAVATADEHALAEDLHKRVEELIAQAGERPDCVESRETQRAAEERLAKLRKAERTLAAHAKESRDAMAAAETAALEAVIESASGKAKIDFRKLEGLTALENQNRVTNRAIEHVIERLIPMAHIVSLRREAHALVTEARIIEQIAQERAEKVLGAMRDAVTEEMVLPVDLSKGVAGALLSHAARLKRRAVQISETADGMERSFEDRARGRR
jgi:hypothetical protein